MHIYNLRRLSIFFWLLLIASLCFLPQDNFAQELGLKLPSPPRTVDLFGLEKYTVDSTYFARKPGAYKRQSTLDSSGTYLTIRESLDDTEFYFPAVVDLQTYSELYLAFNLHEIWRKKFSDSILKQQEAEFGAIELDIPFRIKSKAFTRIFGSDRISLRVTGNISFDLSGRSEERSGSAISARENRNTFSPRFNQTQQFTVEGKIGEKVTVSVQQNSEAVTDIENTLKLRYEGEEDEIVERIEAGNISLSLPSTKYVIFGGSNQGLFGLKTNLRVGNLYMTAIASLEKGEQQQLKISGSSRAETKTIKDYQYLKNRYFFLGESYRRNFEVGYNPQNQQFSYDPVTEITQIDVWLSTSPGDQSTQPIRGIAVLDPVEFQNENPGAELGQLYNDLESIDGQLEKVYFKQLTEGQDYTYDRIRGFVQLNQEVQDNQVLAVSYSVFGGTTIGTFAGQDTSEVILAKLIKPKNQTPTDVFAETWPLMMKNVYSLGGSNIEQEGFEMDIQNNRTGAAIKLQGNNTFLNLLGLDVLDENGNYIPEGDDRVDLNPNFINRAQGILIFPSHEPFDPGPDSKFQGLDPENRVNLYDISLSNNTAFIDSSRYEILVNSKSVRSTFDLGFYVLEGSDVVTLNGRELERDKDYSIDYFSGQLTLLSPEAKRSSADIDIKYERANLFQLDKKTILGTRMEYRFLDNSFLGFTALYLNKSTVDQRVRVGQEPFSNFVWDVNAAFKFKPRFITDVLDWLPLIETSDESQVDFEGEFAQVLPNPNTLNSSSTGDNNGVAYVDDFEASRRSTTLGIRYRTWTDASPPVRTGYTDLAMDTLFRGNMTWFNPYVQVPIKDIWPNRDVNAQTGQTTDVLGLEYSLKEGQDKDNAWVGIMRSTASFADQQKTKFIELWVKGDSGTINIDIGRISEDWYLTGTTFDGLPSRGNLNTEDRNFNGLLDDGEDRGLDFVPSGQPGDDPNDDWREPRRVNFTSDGYDYTGLNGTEGNGNARGARYPDSEDLDGDGLLNVFNDYFTYSFSLDPLLAKKDYLSGSTSAGWRLFRIPLSDFQEIIGNPDPNFQQILFARFWISDLPKNPTRTFLATFDFVGNEWEENGFKLADNDTLDFIVQDSVFNITTYNTEENFEPIAGGPDPYRSPPGVKGEVDRITKARSKEQSLVMRFQNLPAGAIAEARKSLFSAMELVNYKRLKMFMYGSDRAEDTPPLMFLTPEEDSSRVRFYLRFGADRNNYYEYSQHVYLGWNTQLNNIDIDLAELTRVKDDPDKKVLLAGAPGAYYRAVGNPSLNTVRYYTIGVKNEDQILPFTGEVWLDEMRLSDVRAETATALRIKTDWKLADVARFTAEWASKDADFHNVSTQFGEGQTLERQNYSGKINLDKFLPTSWDISVPVDGRASFTRNVPKYVPRTDQLTGYQNKTISQKLKSLFGLRELPNELKNDVSTSETIGLGTTIRKRGTSKNWFLRYTVDQITLDFDYARQNRTSYETIFNRSESYKESYTYKIPFDNNNYFEPFKFLRTTPVLKEIWDTRIYYSPNNINFGLRVNDSKQESLRRDPDPEKQKELTVKYTKNTGAVRSISTSYKLFQNLTMSYSRAHTSDADIDSLSRTDLYKNIVTKFNFGRDTDINQKYDADYKPKLFTWLTPTFSYDATFLFQLTNNFKYRQSSNRVNKRVGVTFSPEKLLKSIYEPKKESPRRRSRPRTRPQPGQNDDQKQEEEKEEKSFPNPLMFLYNAIASWDNIKFDYSLGTNVTNNYLAGMPKWDYQFGFTKNPGVPQDTTLASAENIVLVGPSISENERFGTSTNINIAKNVRVSLRHDITKTLTQTNGGQSASGSESITYFSLGNDPGKGLFDPEKEFKGLGTDIKQFIPDWTVSVSGVEEFLFFKEFAQSIQLDHGHSGKYSEKTRLNREDKFEPTSITFSNNWSPLLGINVRTKWGISGNIRFTDGTNFSYNATGGASKTTNNSFTISMNYSTQAGFKIPLPIWPFKGRTFKNEINFTLTFDSSENASFQRRVGNDNFEEQQKNSSWKLRPSATYRFNSRVQGSMFFEMGATENKISGKYSYSEFGINVNIAIRD